MTSQRLFVFPSATHAATSEAVVVFVTCRTFISYGYAPCGLSPDSNARTDVYIFCPYAIISALYAPNGSTKLLTEKPSTSRIVLESLSSLCHTALSCFVMSECDLL